MLTEEWREIDGIYRIEAKKKRSKFTQEELKNQQHTVLQLNEVRRGGGGEENERNAKILNANF